MHRRRLAAALVEPGLGGWRDVRPHPRRPGDPDRCGPASWPSPCPGWPATRRSGCSRCGRSTTRWRACSGSSCDDRADEPGRTAEADRRGARVRACSRSSSTRCSRASRRGGGRPCSPPAPAPSCSGCSPTPSTSTPERAFANVAAEGILGLAVPIAALVIGDAVLGAEIRGGTFLFTWMSPTPIWQIVLGRWIGGSLVALVDDRPGAAPSPRSSPGRRGAPGRSSSPPSVEAVSYVAVFIAIGCLTRRTAVWSLAFVFLVERLLGAALTGHRPAVADVGVAGDLRRPARRPAGRARPRGHPGGRRRRRAPARRLGRRAGHRHLADAPPAPRRRRRLTPAGRPGDG